MARRKTQKTKSQPGIPKRSQATQKKNLSPGVSPQRRVDITGIIIGLFGALTLISLFTQSTGSVTGWWVQSLRKGIGWSVYLLPMGLIFLSAWMLLRNMDRFPRLSAERLIGITLLFINLTVWFHLFIDGGFSEAGAGLGGGYIGAVFKVWLERGLGKPGATIALTAWLLISLILTLDLTMANVVKRLGKTIQDLFAKIETLVLLIVKKIRSKKSSPSESSSHDKNKLAPVIATPTTHPAADKTTPGAAEARDTAINSDINAAQKQPVWVLPDLDQILDPTIEPPDTVENDRHRARVIEETLRSFGAPVRVVDIRRGPTITLFGVEPAFVESRNGKTRVRVSKITALSDDLALALAASRIRIQAPVPGKGYIGIEVPNQQVALVSLRDVIQSDAYKNLKSPLKMALGKDVAGNPVAADLTAMPHLLIAGTTGAGKSVCINDILSCVLLSMTPDELRLILVDPKRVELTGYNGIPHLLAPVIVEAEHVVGALQWMMREMDVRYRKFSETQTRNLADYNAWCETSGEKKLPYLLVVIDELADLMMLAPDETERAITRLAQLARATGIHLIIATQRPSTDILTGLIKANFPARIAFAVASGVDSRVILDQPGAERLLGRGDMLFQAPDAPAPVRIQSAFVSDHEINRLASYWRGFTVSHASPERPDMVAAFQSPGGVPLMQAPLWEEMDEEKDLDQRFAEAVAIVKAEGQASASMLQRKMRIGYTRAARIIDTMQNKGLVSEPDPKTQIREILDSDQDPV